MEKITRTVLLSILTLCICTALVVGGTWALFSHRITVNNHLAAGNLEVGLYRTSYQECVLNDDGLLATSAVDRTRDNLAENNSELFTVTDVVPMSWYQATLEVSNKGTTAFDYGMRILWTDSDDEENYPKDEVLANQIQITVISDKISDDIADGTVTVTDENGQNPVEVNCVIFMLDQCELKENDISLGYMLANSEAEYFTVRADFVHVDDETTNNLAMNAKVKFDVQVYALQKTTRD